MDWGVTEYVNEFLMAENMDVNSLTITVRLIIKTILMEAYFSIENGIFMKVTIHGLLNMVLMDSLYLKT